MSSGNLNLIKVCIEDGGASALNQNMYWGWRCVRTRSKYVHTVEGNYRGFVVTVETYQIWTNQYVMKKYIILLIMREWFCLNALWKVKKSHENMKRRSFWWKEKLFFKDKCFWSFCCFLKIKFMTKAQVYVNIKMLSFVIMRVIIFYEKKFMKKSFVIF